MDAEVDQLTNQMLDQTLAGFLAAHERILTDLEDQLLAGATLTRTILGDLSSELVVQAAALSSLRRATEALFRLRCWTETNSFANTFTLSQVLRSLTYGSVSATELIDATHSAHMLARVLKQMQAWPFPRVPRLPEPL